MFENEMRWDKMERMPVANGSKVTKNVRYAKKRNQRNVKRAKKTNKHVKNVAMTT